MGVQEPPTGQSEPGERGAPPPLPPELWLQIAYHLHPLDVHALARTDVAALKMFGSTEKYLKVQNAYKALNAALNRGLDKALNAYGVELPHPPRKGMLEDLAPYELPSSHILPLHGLSNDKGMEASQILEQLGPHLSYLYPADAKVLKDLAERIAEEATKQGSYGIVAGLIAYLPSETVDDFVRRAGTEMLGSTCFASRWEHLSSSQQDTLFNFLEAWAGDRYMNYEGRVICRTLGGKIGDMSDVQKSRWAEAVVNLSIAPNRLNHVIETADFENLSGDALERLAPLAIDMNWDPQVRWAKAVQRLDAGKKSSVIERVGDDFNFLSADAQNILRPV